MAEHRTARLTMVPLTMAHFSDVQAQFRDPGVCAIYGTGRDTEERVTNWIAWCGAAPADEAPRFYALLTSDGTYVGQCGLLPQTVDGVEELEVGYLLRDAARGHGYATEAARYWRDRGFIDHAAPHIISIIVPHNTPSIAVAMRNGMHFDRRTRFHDKDVNIYIIDRATWSASVGTGASKSRPMG